MFYCIVNDRIHMPCSSLRNKRQKLNEENLRSLNFVPSGNTKYLQCIENFK